MEPIFGFALYFVASLIVAIVAHKRGRAGWVFFVGCVLIGPVLVRLISLAGGSGMAAGAGAFLIPAAGLMIALSSKTGADMAISKGEFGEFKKCPFCAESIRKEAIKCKHCGSDLPVA